MKWEWYDEDPEWVRKEEPIFVSICSWLLLMGYLLWWGYGFMNTPSQWLIPRETPFPFILTKKLQLPSRANFQIVFLSFFFPTWSKGISEWCPALRWKQSLMFWSAKLFPLWPAWLRWRRNLSVVINMTNNCEWELAVLNDSVVFCFRVRNPRARILGIYPLLPSDS